MYVYILGLIGVIVTAIIIIYATDISRLLKVGYLILATSPYEQQPDDPQGSILVLGDSTGYGTGALDPSKTIAGRIGADFPAYSIENRAVNGWTTEQVASGLANDTAITEFDLIVLQVGGNDVLQRRPIAIVERDIRRLYEGATKRAKNVVHISSGNVGAASAYVTAGQPDATLEEHTRAVREVFLRVAGEYGVIYVDLFIEPAEDVYLKEPKKYLAFDGLHPNETGYGYWYSFLGPVVRTLLGS